MPEKDKKSDNEPAIDRGESVSEMEPVLIHSDSRHRGELTDLVMDLAQRSAGFRRSLPQSILLSLAELVRSMNCYYSNLIEGHNTHPIDIERALKDDFSTDVKSRNLQLEAKAHIKVQRWIDGGGLTGHALTVEAIRDIHRLFCEAVPQDLLWVEDPQTNEKVKVIPGELRIRNVRVGRHIAISPLAVPRFMERFEEVYSKLGKVETILALGAIHHRLTWIHPFLDGNGRVSRLVTHAVLLEGLDTGAIWSLSRGLARNVAAYKSHLAACDLKRRNDLDGRGPLSEENLVEFTRFLLTTCIDQIVFMESLVRPEELRARILLWAEEETRLDRLPQRSGSVLEAILYRGDLPRGEVAALVGTGDRQARRVVSALLERGVLVSESTRSTLRLAFPATLASRWMPGLFPDMIAQR